MSTDILPSPSNPIAPLNVMSSSWKISSFAMLLLLLGHLVLYALACKPTTTLPTELLDLLPPPFVQLLPVITPPPPALSIVADNPMLEPEGSGEDDPQGNNETKAITPRMCLSTVMVDIQTSFPWNEQKLNEYSASVERDFRLLQKYSKTSVSSFGGQMSRNIVRIQTPQGAFYGQRVFVNGITGQCSTVHEFVRKAVSWSTTIPRATVACRCDPQFIIYKT